MHSQITKCIIKNHMHAKKDWRETLQNANSIEIINNFFSLAYFPTFYNGKKNYTKKSYPKGIFKSMILLFSNHFHICHLIDSCSNLLGRDDTRYFYFMDWNTDEAFMICITTQLTRGKPSNGSQVS